MKKLIALILTFTTLNGYSQIIEDFPTDENGDVNFNEVVQVDGASKNELFLRSVQYFANEFKSANDVIQMKDKESAIIIGKGLTSFYITFMGTVSEMNLWFSIKIQSREGRYKYEIYDFYYKSVSGQYSGMTGTMNQWFDKENYFKKNGKVRTINEQYKEKTLEEIRNLKLSIKTSMEKNTSHIDSASSADW